MPNSRHFPRPWARLSVAALALVSVLSCVDGGLFGTGSAVSIGIAPNFQIVESDFGAGPVDRIRATAYEAGTVTIVGTFDEEVDPNAATWDVALAIDLGERSSLSVVVELELFSGEVVVWSARTQPLMARSGTDPAIQEVPVYRGPLDNLDVVGVSISGGPTQLLVGETGTASVEVEVAAGSTVTPTPFWASLDPTVATVVATGNGVTITAVGAGTATIVVAAGPESAEIMVDVLPRVQSVVVAPATTILGAIGLQVAYTAVVTDGFGQVTTSETVVWSTEDGSVATIDATTGLVTTAGFGTTEVRATAGGVTGVATLTVDGISGFDAVWTGELSDDWGVDGNWSTGSVPTAGSNVLIPAVNTLPRLVGGAGVTDLTVEADASLTLADQSVLVVSGNLTVESFAAIEAEGQAAIQMTGTDVTMRGEINPSVSVSGTVILDGNVITEGSVSVIGTGARLNISNHQMLVSGSFLTTAGGVFEMAGSASTALIVDGDIGLTGGSTEGLLTSGVIRARGDFFAGGSIPTVFAPTGLHSVIFEGTGAQEMGFTSPAADETRFAIVWFNSAGTVTTTTDFVVTTELWLFQNAVDAGSGRIFVGGRLRDVVGGLNYGELHFISDVDDVPASLPGTVYIDGAVVWPESSTIDGDLVVSGSLEVADFALTVNGDVTVDGDLTVGEPATVSAVGNLFLNGGSTLDVSGDVSATECVNGGALIIGTGSHPCSLGLLRTWEGGSDLGSTDWFVDANWTPSGAPTVEDDVLVPATSFDPVAGGIAFQIGALTVEPGATLDLGAQTHQVNGDLIVDGQVVNGELLLQTTDGIFVSGAVSGLATTEDRTLAGPLTVDGDLVVLENTLTIGSETLNVTGDLLLDTDAGTAAIRMSDSDGQVQVGGEFGVRGGSLDGLLTDGSLRVAGDLFGNASLFVATGSHITEFNGSGVLQEVAIGTSSATEARFFDVIVAASAQVSFLTDTYVSNDLTLAGDLTVDAAANLDLAGTLILQAGAILNVDGDITATGGCVNQGATILGVGVHPCGIPFDFTWSGGDAGGATAWENASNWQPNGVPDAASSVLVPAANDEPTLAGDANVASLVVEAGMTIDLGGFNLDVVGDLEALGTITNGLVTLSGAGAVLEGSVDDVEITSNRLLTGPLTATGDVTLNNADLTIADQTAVVGGALQLTGLNAQLRMLDPAGVVQVAGDVTFDGGSHVNQLLEGTLTAGGNFSATGAGNNAFTSQSNHTVVFDGGGSQEVLLTTPGIALQRFANVRFEGGGSAFFSSDVVVTGTMEVVAGTTIDATDATVSVGAAYIDPANGLAVNRLSVIGDLTALPATLTTQLDIDATLNLPGSLALTGNLTLNGNDLLVGANVLDVTGNLLVTGTSAQLNMTSGASTVSVGGNVTFDGGTHVNQLTQGTLSVGGDFTATASSVNSFVGQTGHTVVFDGVAAQNVTFSTPGNAWQRFQNVRFEGSGAVTFASDVFAMGSLEVASGATVDAFDDVVSIGGAFIDPLNGMTLQQLDVIGDLTAIPAVLVADVNVNSLFNLPNDVTLTGDLTMNGSRLLIGANQFDVTGDLLVTSTGGQLVMIDPASTVSVTGDVTFDGSSHVNQLTGGTLSIGGDFTAGASAASSFVGQTNHTVVFDGGGLQNVTFTTPGLTSSRFSNVRFEAGSQITFLTDVVVTGDLEVVSGTTVNASDDVVSISGSFVDPANGMSLLQLNVTGDLTAIPATLATDVSVDATFNLPNSLSLTGNLVLNSNRLLIGANSLDVSGDLMVEGTGLLTMIDAASDVNVLGSATFDGGGHVNQLTEGILRVGGDFTATASNANSFVGQTNHTVVLNGDAAQTVTFSGPSTTAQRFANLSIVNVNGSTTFATDFVVSGDFTSDADASVSGPVIWVAGSYLPGGGTSIPEVIVYGDLTAMSSSLTTDVTVVTTFNLPGPLSVTGNVTIDGGRLLVGANALDVSGDLMVSGTGLLTMLDVASDVDILGDATFDGGTHVNQLTNGILRIGGDFTATASNANSFVGQTNHTVVLNGDATQTVSFSGPSTTAQRFANLSIVNVNGSTTFATDFVVSGDFTSDADASVSGPVISVAGSYLPGGGTSMTEVIVYGDLTAISSSLTTGVTVVATFNLPGPLSVTGNVTIDNGRLLVGANALDVSGDLMVSGTGLLTMLDASSDVNVGGDATFDGGTHVNQLTEGILRVAGDFTATASNTNSFVGQTNHTVVLNGDVAQTVSFSGPSTTTQRFANLSIVNVNGSTTFATDFVVSGDFTSDADASVSGPVVSVAGSYLPGGGTSMTQVIVYGDLSAITSSLTTDMTVVATFNLPGPLSVTGNVTIDDGRLLVGANALDVSGDLLVTGTGLLTMLDVASDVDILGDATFDGGTHVNQLTNGILRIGGDFTATASNANSFVGQTAHTTVFNGSLAQSITFSGPSTTAQRFHHLTLSNFSEAITFLSDAVAFGDFTVFAGVSVDASDDALSVGGSYEDGSDGISIQELVVVGNLSSHSGSLNGNLTVNATWNLTDNFFVTGDVSVNSSRLVLDGNPLSVGGDFDVTGSGQLAMTVAGDLLDVVGDVTFAGGTHVNQLTEGTISLQGDFTASGSTSAFVGQSNHTVDFVGTTLQTVTFDNPGVSAQRFANLTLSFPAQVGMATTAVATGTFSADDFGTSLIRAGAVGTVLDLRGTVDIFELTVDGLPIRVESSVATNLHTIENIDFTNMNGTEVQLYLELPGSAIFASLTTSALNFDQVLTTGAYVETASTNGLNWVLQMDSPTPGSAFLGSDYLTDGIASVVWPWP